nr:hypothetical protein [Candidatus Njordarchaeota archaeon]
MPAHRIPDLAQILLLKAGKQEMDKGLAVAEWGEESQAISRVESTGKLARRGRKLEHLT